MNPNDYIHCCVTGCQGNSLLQVDPRETPVTCPTMYLNV